MDCCNSLCVYESKNIDSPWELNKSLDTTFAVPLPTSTIFCHTGDNTELRVANPNLLPQFLPKPNLSQDWLPINFTERSALLKNLNLFLLSSIWHTATFANSHLIVDFSTSSQHSLFWTTALTYHIPMTVYGLFSTGASIAEWMWFHISWRCPWHYPLQSQRSPVYHKPFDSWHS